MCSPWSVTITVRTGIPVNVSYIQTSMRQKLFMGACQSAYLGEMLSLICELEHQSVYEPMPICVNRGA